MESKEKYLDFLPSAICSEVCFASDGEENECQLCAEGFRDIFPPIV